MTDQQKEILGKASAAMRSYLAVLDAMNPAEIQAMAESVVSRLAATRSR